MQSSSSSSGIVMNVNRIRTTNGTGEMSSWVFLVVALVIGYVMGSATSLSSLWTAAWNGLLFLEGWIRDVMVPVYTLSALAYLWIDDYYDGTPKVGRKSLRSTLPSIQKLPILRMISTLTTEDESDSLTPSSLVSADEQEDEEEEEEEKPIDMNGVFKVVENDNFGAFLKAQGVPGFLCSAAAKARPTHHFTHSSFKKLTIKIQGIIESQTSYQINGPHTETSIRGRLFQDSLSYLWDENNDNKTCVGVQTKKLAVGEGYVVEVERRIIRAGCTWTPTPEENPDGHCTYDLDVACDFDRLIMTNKVVYDNGDEPVIASQLFHRTD